VLRFCLFDCCVKITMDERRQVPEAGHSQMSNVKRVASPQISSRTMANQGLDVDQSGRLLSRMLADART